MHNISNFMDVNLSESIGNKSGTPNSTYQDNLTFFGFGTLAAFHAMRICEALLSLIGNSLTIVAVMRSPVLQTPSNVLVVGLAIADLAGVPFAILALVTDMIVHRSSHWAYINMCLIQETIGLISRAGNVYFICGLVIERYSAVMFPLWYLTHITVQRVVIVFGVTWVYIVSFCSLLLWLGNSLASDTVCRFTLFLPSKLYLTLIIGHYVFITCVTIALHFRLWHTAWKQARRIRSIEMMFGRPSTEQHRMTRTVGIVLGTYLALTAPVTIMSLISNGYTAYLGGVRPKWLRTIDLFMQNIWFANSFINPFIYAFRHESFRKGFRRLFDHY